MRYAAAGLLGLLVGYVAGIVIALVAGTIVGDDFGQVGGGRYIAFAGAGIGAVAGLLLAGRSRSGQGS